jgi:hypothetical protein
MINEGVSFSDGVEQALVGTWGLWSSIAYVTVVPDYGSYGGQYEEKKMQREWYQDHCNVLRTCTDFRVISHTVGTTDEGYHTLTMKYSQTNTYPDLSGKYPMINYAKHVYVGNDLWSIDIETDKVILELPAPVSGTLTKIIKGDGATVVSGELIATIDSEATAPPKKGTTTSKKSTKTEKPVMMPAAKRKAAERNLSTEEVITIHGSGRGGRILKEDIVIVS